MTIKKSDLLALLEDLPDELDRESFIHIGDQLFGPSHQLSQEQVDSLDAALAEAKESGGVSFAEYEARMDAWRSKSGSPRGQLI